MIPFKILTKTKWRKGRIVKNNQVSVELIDEIMKKVTEHCNGKTVKWISFAQNDKSLTVIFQEVLSKEKITITIEKG